MMKGRRPTQKKKTEVEKGNALWIGWKKNKNEKCFKKRLVGRRENKPMADGTHRWIEVCEVWKRGPRPDG